MILARIAVHLWEILRTDRVVHAGATSSGVSLWGSRHLPALPSELQQYVALFAAMFGGLSAMAVFVYTCLRIWRLLKNPAATD